MAKTTKKKNPKSAEVADEDLDDLAALEELADLENDEDEDEDEDEVLDEDEDDEDDDNEDEAPKKKGKKSKAKKEREPRDFVGTQEIAERAGVDSRTLRMVLRKHAIEKDPESNQYRWDSFSDPTVKKILKLLKGGEADKVKKEGLDRLKAQKEEKDKKKGKKKGDAKGGGKKGKKKAKKVVDEDDDE